MFNLVMDLNNPLGGVVFSLFKIVTRHNRLIIEVIEPGLVLLQFMNNNLKYELLYTISLIDSSCAPYLTPLGWQCIYISGNDEISD